MYTDPLLDQNGRMVRFSDPSFHQIWDLMNVACLPHMPFTLCCGSWYTDSPISISNRNACTSFFPASRHFAAMDGSDVRVGRGTTDRLLRRSTRLLRLPNPQIAALRCPPGTSMSPIRLPRPFFDLLRPWKRRRRRFLRPTCSCRSDSNDGKQDRS